MIRANLESAALEIAILNTLKQSTDIEKKAWFEGIEAILR